MDETTNLSRSVGSLLKSQREKIGVNQGEIATKASISVSMLSQIERGVTSPSIDTLNKICNALSLPVSKVFASLEEKGEVIISKHGERATKEAHGVYFEEITSHRGSSDSAELCLISLENNSRITFTANRENRSGTQVGYILSGSAILIVDGEEYKLRSGDGVSFPASCEHTIFNRLPSSFKLARKCIVLWLVSPSQRRDARFK